MILKFLEKSFKNAINFKAFCIFSFPIHNSGNCCFFIKKSRTNCLKTVTHYIFTKYCILQQKNIFYYFTSIYIYLQLYASVTDSLHCVFNIWKNTNIFFEMKNFIKLELSFTSVDEFIS